MKFSEITICAGCAEVREWNVEACPSCGDTTSWRPEAFLGEGQAAFRRHTEAALREVIDLLDQHSAVRARR